MSSKRSKSKPARRIDPARTSEPPPPHAPVQTLQEVQAVQVQRPILVQTRHGAQLAATGEWLVTEADGSVQIFTDRAFRLQALHQQLGRLLSRARSRG